MAQVSDVLPTPLTGATLLLEHERGRQALEPTPIEIALGEPTWREDHLVRLLKERLGRIELTAPVIALRLDASDVQPAVPASDTLFPEPPKVPYCRPFSVCGRERASSDDRYMAADIYARPYAILACLSRTRPAALAEIQNTSNALAKLVNIPLFTGC